MPEKENKASNKITSKNVVVFIIKQGNITVLLNYSTLTFETIKAVHTKIDMKIVLTFEDIIFPWNVCRDGRTITKNTS